MKPTTSSSTKNVGLNAKSPLPLPPFLKWVGGKRWLVSRLAAIYEAYRSSRLVEPFCGGLAVALGLRPENALLNDSNTHLINLYRCVATGLAIDIPMANDEALYYRHRSRFNELIESGRAQTHEAAELFYYLNRTGFNGLCRFNRGGGFNVPFGRYRTIRYARLFGVYQEAFVHWQFVSGDFTSLVLAPDDFIYADPPYDSAFNQYTVNLFTWKDQVRLVSWLTRHSGPIVLSNQDTPRIRDLYESFGFHLITIEAPRRISANGARKPVQEILALKNIDVAATLLAPTV